MRHDSNNNVIRKTQISFLFRTIIRIHTYVNIVIILRRIIVLCGVCRPLKDERVPNTATADDTVRVGPGVVDVSESLIARESPLRRSVGRVLVNGFRRANPPARPLLSDLSRINLSASHRRRHNTRCKTQLHGPTDLLWSTGSVAAENPGVVVVVDNVGSTSAGGGRTCWRMSRWRRVCVVTLFLTRSVFVSLLSLFLFSVFLYLSVPVSPDPEPPFPRNREQRSEGSRARRGSGGLMKCEIKLARRALTAAGWLPHHSPICMSFPLPDRRICGPAAVIVRLPRATHTTHPYPV